jgi:hypothetical protein
MNPHLSENDMKMFYKYLDKAKVYFEYGSGGTTYQASIRENIIKIYSVESDETWLDKHKKNIKSNNVIFFYNEMNTLPNTWGHPGPNSTPIQHINYSNHIRNISEEEQASIDFILIDGRFRVACCLKCFDIINPNCLIAFDDFLNREHYHIVLDYYDIIEETIDNRMVILQKKKNINSIPTNIINKYEIIVN